jgi:hypothetical protein
MGLQRDLFVYIIWLNSRPTTVNYVCIYIVKMLSVHLEIIRGNRVDQLKYNKVFSF